MARSKGSAEYLERRRRLAVSRVNDDGVAVVDVAREQRVTARVIHMWLKAARENGEEALASTPHPGRTSKLTAEQEKQVLAWFTRSPTEFGYANELWTGARVVEQIRKHLGVEFNPRYILRWLGSRGISPQKPETFARERDDKEIKRWLREEMPRILKNARDTHATIVVIDECGLLLAPLVRRTLAPRGKTPVVRQRGRHREKVSVIAGLAMSPRRCRLRLFFRTYPRETINNVKAADFLRSLLRQIRGNLIVIWDNGNMHRGDPIRELLSQTRRLHLERLPPYAPDCNPTEFLWKHAKYEKMPNFFANDVDEINREVRRHLRNAGKSQRRMRTFVTQSRLKDVLIRN